MLRNNKTLRLIFLLSFIAVSFHLLGVETAFCNDAPLQAADASSHGCSACQPGQHSVTLQEQNTPTTTIFSHYLPMENVSFFVEEPHFSLLRPPISA